MTKFSNSEDCIKALGEHCWFTANTKILSSGFAQEEIQICRHCTARRAKQWVELKD